MAGFAGVASVAGAALGVMLGAAGAAGVAGAAVCAELNKGVDRAAALKSVIKSLFILVKSKKRIRCLNCLINQTDYKSLSLN